MDDKIHSFVTIMLAVKSIAVYFLSQVMRSTKICVSETDGMLVTQPQVLLLGCNSPIHLYEVSERKYSRACAVLVIKIKLIDADFYCARTINVFGLCLLQNSKGNSPFVMT